MYFFLSYLSNKPNQVIFRFNNLLLLSLVQQVHCLSRQEREMSVDFYNIKAM